MPSPKKGEKKKDFLSRCMGHPHTQKWKNDQRYAICNSFWDEHLNEEVELDEKDMRGEIQSKSQRRLMGWAHACDKGLTDTCPSSIKDVAKGFKTKKDLKKMASHKEKGLPEKKVSESMVGDTLINKKLAPKVEKAVDELATIAKKEKLPKEHKDVISFLARHWIDTLPNADALEMAIHHPKFGKIARKWQQAFNFDLTKFLGTVLKGDREFERRSIKESHKMGFMRYLFEGFNYQLQGKVLNPKRSMKERIEALKALTGKNDITEDDVEKFTKQKRLEFHQAEIRNSGKVN